MDQINMWWIRTTKTQYFLKICLKNKRYNWRWKILHADQRQKQNRTEGNQLINSTIIIPMKKKELDWYWTRELLSAYEVSKKIVYLLRHSQQVQREDDGAVHFRRIKKHLPHQFSHNPFLLWQSMESILCSKKRFNKEISVLHWYFRNNSLSTSSSTTFRTQSYWSFITG